LKQQYYRFNPGTASEIVPTSILSTKVKIQWPIVSLSQRAKLSCTWNYRVICRYCTSGWQI